MGQARFAVPWVDAAPRLKELAAPAALLVVLCAWPAFVHVDDTDAGLYRTVVRHMADDGTWTQLRYLPSAHPQFREHLPFGLWPFALAQRLGDAWPPVVAYLTALGTLALLARRRPLAAVLLGLTPAFFTHAALVRLDGWMLLGATLVTLALSDEALDWRAWAFAALGTALGVAVKGPFGLVPLVAWCVVRAWRGRAPAVLAVGGGLGALALLPPTVFLLTASADWWQGYVVDQLLASASRSRADGSSAPWAPLGSVLGRFWPGLAVLGLGVLRGGDWKSERVLRLGAATALMLVLLALSGRHVWNHTFVVYPALALLAAELVGSVPERLTRLAQVAAVGGAGVVLLAGLSGAAAKWSPCVVPVSARAWHLAHPAQPLGVVPPPTGTPWKLLATLAAELRSEPVLVDDVGRARAAGLPLLVQGPAPTGYTCSTEAPWVLCLPGTQ